MATDPIDRSVYLARSGRPHNPAISHLTETHSLPATAGHILNTVRADEKDPDTLRLLQALPQHRDDNPESPTFGCYKWFLEDPTIHDTNASFFTCSPLAVLFFCYRKALTSEEANALEEVFRAGLPWFRRTAQAPSLFYPNKCLADAAMLLAAGHILRDTAIVTEGQDFCARWFDYLGRRGMGWGEDHSPVYTKVIVEMALLIMVMEEAGTVYDQARGMTDQIVDWALFNEGYDAVPSIRGYNFDCKMRVDYAVAALAAKGDGRPANTLTDLAARCAYSCQPQPLAMPRQRRRRTFDDQYSVSYIGEHARLGTLSHYPLMPNGYMHDGWGLGWQSKPASFIIPDEDYGVLEWQTEDDEGVVRQHEAAGSIHDWPSRHLFKRLSFHPEVVFTGHQQGKAAIIFREIRRLHSPTTRLVDRWRLAHFAGRILIGGQEWDGQAVSVPAGWLVLQYQQAAVAIHPLQGRGLDAPDNDPNPQRRLRGGIFQPSVHLKRTDRGVHLSVALIEDNDQVVTQPLLFSGWCVVLLERPAQVEQLSVLETFQEDGELPRTYGELIRTVKLTTPEAVLTLTRDMLTAEETRQTAPPEPGRGCHCLV